jgi:hypothetical protein
MIWYRHWLELRARLLFLAAAAIVLGAWPLTLFDQENAAFIKLLGSGPPAADAEALALSISRTIFVVWGGAIVVCGNGLRTWHMDRIAPSDMDLPFTLTLPVPRARLVRTRLTAGWLMAVLVAVLVMGSQGAVHAIQGHSVPLAPMVAAVGLLAVGMMAWVIVLGWALMARGVWVLASGVTAILTCFPLSLALVIGGLTGDAKASAFSLASLAGLGAAAYVFTIRRAGRLEC